MQLSACFFRIIIVAFVAVAVAVVPAVVITRVIEVEI